VDRFLDGDITASWRPSSSSAPAGQARRPGVAPGGPCPHAPRPGPRRLRLRGRQRAAPGSGAPSRSRGRRRRRDRHARGFGWSDGEAALLYFSTVREPRARDARVPRGRRFRSSGLFEATAATSWWCSRSTTRGLPGRDDPVAATLSLTCTSATAPSCRARRRPGLVLSGRTGRAGPPPGPSKSKGRDRGSGFRVAPPAGLRGVLPLRGLVPDPPPGGPRPGVRRVGCEGLSRRAACSPVGRHRRAVPPSAGAARPTGHCTCEAYPPKRWSEAGEHRATTPASAKGQRWPPPGSTSPSTPAISKAAAHSPHSPRASEYRWRFSRTHAVRPLPPRAGRCSARSAASGRRDRGRLAESTPRVRWTCRRARGSGARSEAVVGERGFARDP